MTEQWGRPALPARPKSPGALVSWFAAYMDRGALRTNRRGELTVTLTVPNTDKWKALLLDEAEGWHLHVEIRRPEVDDMADLAAKLGIDLAEGG